MDYAGRRNAPQQVSKMALSVLLVAIALLRVVKGEYLAPRSFSFRSSNVLSLIESNSTCEDDQVLPVLTPNGPTSQNLTCSTDLNTLSAIAGSATIPNSEWLSSPGDGAVELRLGFRVSCCDYDMHERD